MSALARLRALAADEPTWDGVFDRLLALVDATDPATAHDPHMGPCCPCVDGYIRRILAARAALVGDDAG